jgi:hypothetical protein
VRYEPERAVATLPVLLRDPRDRENLITLVRRLLADERMRRNAPSSEQIAMLENLGETLHISPLPGRRRAAARATRKPVAKPVAKRRRVPA